MKLSEEIFFHLFHSELPKHIFCILQVVGKESFNKEFTLWCSTKFAFCPQECSLGIQSVCSTTCWLFRHGDGTAPGHHPQLLILDVHCYCWSLPLRCSGGHDAWAQLWSLSPHILQQAEGDSLDGADTADTGDGDRDFYHVDDCSVRAWLEEHFHLSSGSFIQLHLL